MTPAGPESGGQRGSDPHQRAGFDDALDCVITMDDRGCVTYLNKSAERTFGFRSSEVVGRELADVIVPPSHRDAHRRGVTSYLGTGESRILGRRVELTAMRADGTEFPVELTVIRVEPSAGGGFVGFVRDITERVRAEEELRSAHRSVELVANEQAALRRVATLVARGVTPDEIFSAVTNEVGQLFGSDQTAIGRYEPDGSGIVWVGVSQGLLRTVPIGTRWPLEDFLVSTKVYRTGRPARQEERGYETASGPVVDTLRELNIVATVAAPIVVDGNLWGVMTVSDRRERLPIEAEERVAKFTELVATAIANADSRWALGRLLEEQASLRRVATLVARAPASEELFSAVAREVASVLNVPGVIVTRYEADGTAVTLGEAFAPDLAGAGRFLGVGAQTPPDPGSLAAQVHDTHGPARIDDFSTLPGTVGDLARGAGLGCGCAGPIVVNGALWGKMCVFSRVGTVLPAGMENRLQDFIELVATAIANYEAHTGLRTLAEELAASRARIVAAADDARRRIERDLHDGAQQRLVTLAIAARRAETKLPPGSDEIRAAISRVEEGLITAVDELRELSQGIHPAELTEGGLSPALKALGRRSAVRVELDLPFEDRLSDQVEVAAYYTVSEALTNASKHADAKRVWVSLRIDGDMLLLSIRDDGVGGADPARGSGLTGLRDRIEALGGKLRIESPSEGGTLLAVEIPIAGPADWNPEPDELLAQATTPGPSG